MLLQAFYKRQLSWQAAPRAQQAAEGPGMQPCYSRKSWVPTASASAGPTSPDLAPAGLTKFGSGEVGLGVEEEVEASSNEGEREAGEVCRTSGVVRLTLPGICAAQPAQSAQLGTGELGMQGGCEGQVGGGGGQVGGGDEQWLEVEEEVVGRSAGAWESAEQRAALAMLRIVAAQGVHMLRNSLFPQSQAPGVGQGTSAETAQGASPPAVANPGPAPGILSPGTTGETIPSAFGRYSLPWLAASLCFTHQHALLDGTYLFGCYVHQVDKVLHLLPFVHSTL